MVHYSLFNDDADNNTNNKNNNIMIITTISKTKYKVFDTCSKEIKLKLLNLWTSARRSGIIINTPYCKDFF